MSWDPERGWAVVRSVLARWPDRLGLNDEAGVRAAYATYGAELYRFAVRFLHDDGLAQDAVQETFLRAWRASDRYDASLASMRVWLFAIARNVVTDQARRASVRPWQHDLVPTAEPDDVEADPGDALVQTWLVEEALRRLSADHRRAIVETYLRERPYAEVAAEEGIPVGTLRSRVYYALRALRLAMDEMGVEP